MDRLQTAVIAACVGFLLMRLVSTTGGACVPTTTKRVSIVSERNDTGHWISQIELQREMKKTVSGQWVADVDYNTVTCGSTRSVVISATFIVPPEKFHDGGLGYEVVPGLGSYKLHQEHLTWEEAWRACSDEGAHLAILNSELEASVLRRLFTHYPATSNELARQYAYAGFSDHYPEGVFKTVFYDPVISSGYVKWAAGNPKGGTVHNCGCLDRTMLMHDVACASKMPFFCEMYPQTGD